MLHLKHFLNEHNALVFSTFLIIQFQKSLFLGLFETFLRNDPELRRDGFVEGVLKDLPTDIRNFSLDSNRDNDALGFLIGRIRQFGTAGSNSKTGDNDKINPVP